MDAPSLISATETLGGSGGGRATGARRGGERGSGQEPDQERGGEQANRHRGEAGYDYGFTFSKSARYLPYPSSSSLATGMKRSAAELMQ